MEHILTGPYNKPTNNSRRPPRGAYHFGDFAIQKIETKDIADFLSQWVKTGKVTMANLIRAFLRDLFREAIAEGLIKTNPVEAT
ncbi:MAG: phage integrase central domain-containing protein [Sodalis sp. (in: enterobacteria)]|uniref:phage integrase central domain-containing protein n=1 Tax=Sodalis sp. (in: enterobacteria) TaxID=1898979 RepID=UPI0039E5080E